MDVNVKRLLKGLQRLHFLFAKIKFNTAGEIFYVNN